MYPAQWMANYPTVLQKIVHAIEQSVQRECRQETTQGISQLVQQKLAINSDYQNVLALYRQFKEMIENLNHFELQLEQSERQQQVHVVTAPFKETPRSESETITNEITRSGVKNTDDSLSKVMPNNSSSPSVNNKACPENPVKLSQSQLPSGKIKKAVGKLTTLFRFGNKPEVNKATVQNRKSDQSTEGDEKSDTDQSHTTYHV